MVKIYKCIGGVEEIGQDLHHPMSDETGLQVHLDIRAGDASAGIEKAMLSAISPAAGSARSRLLYGAADLCRKLWAALQEAPKHRVMVAAVLQNQQALSALDQGKEIPLQRFLDHALYCLHKRHGSLKEAGILPPELTALPGPLPVIGGEGPAAPNRVLIVGSSHKYCPEKKPVQKLTEIKGIIHAVVYMKNHDIL